MISLVKSKKICVNLKFTQLFKNRVDMSTVVPLVVFAVSTMVLITKGEISHKDADPTSLFETNTLNWTNCSTFTADSTINISAIVENDWMIFYFWTLEGEDSYTFRFSVPSELILKGLRDTAGYNIHPPVNWSNAELYLETSVDMSGVFIRTDTPGVFRFVPTTDLDFVAPVELLFGIKVVDDYLGIMGCLGKYAYALAPASKMPKQEEVHRLAEKFNFWNPYGRSYLDQKKEPFIPDDVPPPADLDDDEEDEGMQIEKSKKTFQMF